MKKVWIRNAFKDELYGMVSLDAEPNNKHIMLECNLTGSSVTRGKLQIEVQSMSSITAL